VGKEAKEMKKGTKKIPNWRKNWEVRQPSTIKRKGDDGGRFFVYIEKVNGINNAKGDFQKHLMANTLKPWKKQMTHQGPSPEKSNQREKTLTL